MNHSTIDESTTVVWDRIADFWAANTQNGNAFHHTYLAPAIERLMRFKPDAKLLDLGCGSGHLSRRFVELGASVVACDGSERMLANAREIGSNLGSHPTYVKADLTRAEDIQGLGEWGPFDGVICNMVAMNLPDLVPLASGIGELVAPDASFVLTLCHPCFNAPATATLTAEQFEREGQPFIQRSIKVIGYLTPYSIPAIGIFGQPEPHPNFHRPISAVLKPFFDSGWFIDALEEPISNNSGGSAFSWQQYSDFPPVLVIRMRKNLGWKSSM